MLNWDELLYDGHVQRRIAPLHSKRCSTCPSYRDSSQMSFPAGHLKQVQLHHLACQDGMELMQT